MSRGYPEVVVIVIFLLHIFMSTLSELRFELQDLFTQCRRQSELMTWLTEFSAAPTDNLGAELDMQIRCSY